MPARAADAEATFNDGRCRFVPSAPIPVGTATLSAAIGDLDGDGKRFVVVANEGSNEVSVLMGLGGETFAAVQVSVGTAPRSVAIADVSGDDELDLMVTDSGSGTAPSCSGPAPARRCRAGAPTPSLPPSARQLRQRLED